MPHALSRRALWSWCLFDWANSPFPTLVSTFVFATYFSQAVAPTPEIGATWWGTAAGVSGLLVALSAPVLGLWADHSGHRKRWLALWVAIQAAATAMLWFTVPRELSGGDWALDGAFCGLLWVVIASVAFELMMVYYNAMLPEVAPPDILGKVSGWGWGLGYAGGLAALVLALVGLVMVDPPPFGLSAGSAEPVRASMLLVSLWLVVFSLPLFLWVPDSAAPLPSAGSAPPSSGGFAIGPELRRLWSVLRSHRRIGRFLLAQMLYLDGINTLFAFGGLYAASVLGLSMSDVMMLGIALNVSAGLGAALFGRFDDRFGAVWVIFLSLLGLSGLLIGLLLVDQREAFLTMAVASGFFFGPVQASSRSLMARLAPAEVRTEMFGLAALSGKITSFAGPLVVGWGTAAFGSLRGGMALILVFLFAGMLFLGDLLRQKSYP